MSPYDYNDDAFWREREKETIVTDVRHNFAFVFQQVVMIHILIPPMTHNMEISVAMSSLPVV